MESAISALVVGGGVAGLGAALELARNGCQVTLLEARPRSGGRILSVPGSNDKVELGAEFIHGRNELLWDFIKKENLATIEVPDKHSQPTGPGRFESVELWDELEPLMDEMAAAREDCSFAEFISSKKIRPSLRQHAIDFVEGFNDADQHRIGIRG